MRMQSNIGKLALSLYLILMGIISFGVSLPLSTQNLDVFGIIVGILLLLGI